MPLRLLTLNIESSLHLPRVHAALLEHRPDVACLQEVYEHDCPYLAATGDYKVVYSVNGLRASKDDPLGPRSWGIAILSRLPILDSHATCYTASDDVNVLVHPNASRRMMLSVRVRQGGRDYRIITTHFTWSAHGETTEQQLADFARLRRSLAGQEEYVLCGDFNAPRGAQLFSCFVTELPLIDNLPADVLSTIDPKLHRVPGLQRVVDNIFSTAGIQVSDVQVLEGLSDHKGILAMVR